MGGAGLRAGHGAIPIKLAGTREDHEDAAAPVAPIGLVEGYDLEIEHPARRVRVRHGQEHNEAASLRQGFFSRRATFFNLLTNPWILLGVFSSLFGLARPAMAAETVLLCQKPNGLIVLRATQCRRKECAIGTLNMPGPPGPPGPIGPTGA